MCSEFHVRFVIQEKIGEGTFSDVWKCQNLVNKKIYAVKRLKRQFKHLTEAQNLPELLVLEKLPTHPNVLPLIEYIFNPQDSKIYMVFELMDMTLYDLIQNRKRCLPENQVKNMIYQIMKGVDHLHSNGVFHRDIKPENILLKKMVVKLADLGSVRGINNQQPYTDYISTRWYRAPECILTAGFYGPKMDIWACGCVFYELLTSKPIFPGANEIDQLSRIHQVTGTPSPRVLQKIRRHLPRLAIVKFTSYIPVHFTVILPFASENARDLLKRMLIYDPDARCTVRRVLEHRYFNDLREMENMIKPHEARKKSPALKQVPKEKVKGKEVGVFIKKVSRTKLTTNSWVPTTKTSKVSIAPTRSKPNNKVVSSNEAIHIKKKITKSPVKSSKLMSSSTSSKQTEAKAPANTGKVKAKSVGTLPLVSFKKQITSKSQVHKPTEQQIFLPPIPEI